MSLQAHASTRRRLRRWGLFFRPATKPAPVSGPKTRRRCGSAKGVHIAFVAKDHAAVDGFHKAGLKAGGKDNGAPGPRPGYGPKYYAAFLLDPDGNNVEAVCLK